MYMFRSGVTPKSFRASLAEDKGTKDKMPKLSSSTSPLPAQLLPSLRDWQQRKDTPQSSKKTRLRESSSNSIGSSSHSVAPLDLISVSQSRDFTGRSSPGGTSPPGIGRSKSPKIFLDAGRSNVFSPTQIQEQDEASPQRIKTASTDRTQTPMSGRLRYSTKQLLKGSSQVLKPLTDQQDDAIHPRLGILKKTWDSFELFAEYASGQDDPKQGKKSILKNLNERSTMLDFAELLDLLRSLQLLCKRDAIFNPRTQVNVTRVHEIFRQVNKLEWLNFISSSGLVGEANMDQLTFEEYKVVMLCIAESLQVPLGYLVPDFWGSRVTTEELFPENTERQALIDMVKAVTERARKKGIENTPGTAQFLARNSTQDGVSLAFENVHAARLACEREEFNDARARAQYAQTLFLHNLRPDLLCEIRLIFEHITRQENYVIACKKKVQNKVEAVLQESNRLSRELKVDEARAQINKAAKMSEDARLTMKGTLRQCFHDAEENIEQAMNTIEGDKKLAIAWKAVQRDELKDARLAFEDAKKFFKGIRAREAAQENIAQALKAKTDVEETRRLHGRDLMEKANAQIEEKNFDAAQEHIEQARAVFMEWTTPIGRDQSLTEQATRLFHTIWKHDKLYDSFCVFDLNNLSGAGQRALLMDFNELLHMLRALGILSERQKEGEDDEDKESKKMPKSQRDALAARQMMVDQCTTAEIRKSDKVKIAKADVYMEFRAVNKMSMTDLAKGNLDADDDMSSLDWGEYQILIMRIAKILDVPVTDMGCSPLFSRDIEKVDALANDLNQVKRDYINAIVARGEEALTRSKLVVQDKKKDTRFADAIEEVKNAEFEYQKVCEVTKGDLKATKGLQLKMNCARQLENIERERVREMHRRADEVTQGDAALKKAQDLYEEFEATGALFDDNKFAIIETSASASWKHFTSAFARSENLKKQYNTLLSKTAAAREEIVRLRQGVTQANSNIEEARQIIEILNLQSGDTRNLKRALDDRISRIDDRPTTPMAWDPNLDSPFERPLLLLVHAKELYTQAKVIAEFKELSATLDSLYHIATERKQKLIQEGLLQVQASQNFVKDAEVAQNSSADQVATCYRNSRSKLDLAKHAFHRASFSNVVLGYFTKENIHSNEQEVGDMNRILQSMEKKAENDGAKTCQDMEDEIVRAEEAWAKRHAKEVKEAFNAIDMCEEAIVKKAFTRANDCLKRAIELFKHTHSETVAKIRTNLNQAEMKDRTDSKKIKGDAKDKLLEAQAAVEAAQLQLAVERAEEALEMSHRCDDSNLLTAAEKMKRTAVTVALKTYSTAQQEVQELITGAEKARDHAEFVQATASVQKMLEVLQTKPLLDAIRALKHVDPFTEYPMFEAMWFQTYVERTQQTLENEGHQMRLIDPMDIAPHMMAQRQVLAESWIEAHNEQIAGLQTDIIAKERAWNAHQAFSLHQDIVRMREVEVLCQSLSRPELLTRRQLEDMQTQLIDVAEVVKHDPESQVAQRAKKWRMQHAPESLHRAEILITKVEELVQAQKDLDTSLQKEASQLLVQAQTAHNYGQYFDAKRLAYGSQAHLIRAKVIDNEFEKSAMIIKNATDTSLITINRRRIDFERFTLKAFEAFEKSEFQKAIEHAEASRNCLLQCINDQLIFGNVDPCSRQYVKLMESAENSARDISRFCEAVQALSFASVVSLSSLPNFYMLTSTECPSYLYPVLPVSSFYTAVDFAEVFVGSLLQEASTCPQDKTQDNTFGRMITPSEASNILDRMQGLGIVEKTGSGGKGGHSSELPNQINSGMKEVVQKKVPVSDWLSINARVNECLEIALRGRTQEDYDEKEEYDEKEDYEDEEYSSENEMIPAKDEENPNETEDKTEAEPRENPESSQEEIYLKEEGENKSTPLISQRPSAQFTPESKVSSSSPSTASDLEGSVGLDEKPRRTVLEHAQTFTFGFGSPAPARHSLQNNRRASAGPTLCFPFNTVFEAILAKDFEVASAMIKAGADVNSSHGHVPQLKLTDANSIDVTVKAKSGSQPGKESDSKRDTLLFNTVMAKNVSPEMVRFLLENGAHVHRVTVKLRNVLHLAALQDRVDILEVIASGSNSGTGSDETSAYYQLRDLLDSKDSEGKTPLVLALDHKCTDAIACLVSLGANTWDLGTDGFNCLHRAIHQGYLAAVPVLLESMKDIEAKTAEGMNSLMVACSKRSLLFQSDRERLVKILLSRGASANFQDASGQSPLHLAAQVGDQGVVRLLLDADANADALDWHGVSPSYYCIIEDHAPCLRLMIDRDKIVEVLDMDLMVHGASLLYTATCLGRQELVSLMIDNGSNILQGSSTGFTSLHCAIWQGYDKIVEILAKAHSADAASQKDYARIYKVANCLAVLGDKHGERKEILRILQKYPPKNEEQVHPHDPVRAWNAEKLAVLLGRSDLLPYFKEDIWNPDASYTLTSPSQSRGATPDKTLNPTAPNDSKEQINSFDEGCCLARLPMVNIDTYRDTSSPFVSGIMSMLFSDDFKAIDLATACFTENLNILSESNESAVLVGNSQYRAVFRQWGAEVPKIVGSRPNTSSESEDVPKEYLEIELVRRCYPVPPVPSRMIAHAIGNFKAQTKRGISSETFTDNEGTVVSAEVQARLTAENEALQRAISQAQDQVLEKRRIRAAKMRVMLNRARLASLAGSAVEAFDFLDRAKACIEQTEFQDSSNICKICAYSEKLHGNSRHKNLITLFYLNLESTEKCISLKDNGKASETLKMARNRLDDLLGYSNRPMIDTTTTESTFNQLPDEAIDAEKRALQTKYQEVEDLYILTEVTAHSEVLIQEVCAHDAARRNKMAENKYCRKMIGLINAISSLLKSLELHEFSQVDINSRIEDVRLARVSFIIAGKFMSQNDHKAIQCIVHVIHGISSILHAWMLLADASGKVECVDGLSLLLARKCVFESQHICATSREDFKLLVASQLPIATENMSAEVLDLRKSRLIPDVELIQRMGRLGTNYIQVASKLLDEIQARSEDVLRKITGVESSFLECKIRESLSDLFSDIENNLGDPKIQIEPHLDLLESTAQSQYDASEYEKCLETMADWHKIADGGGISKERIANADQFLKKEDRVKFLRSKQKYAESTLDQAINILDSDPDKAKEMLDIAQAEFHEVNEKRPSVLKGLAETSLRIISFYFKSMVEQNIVTDAVRISVRRSFEAAEIALKSSFDKMKQALEAEEFDTCVNLAVNALSNFRSRIDDLSSAGVLVPFDSTLAKEVQKFHDETVVLATMEAAALRAEKQLRMARNTYNGFNFDEARDNLSIARKFSETASHRLKKRVGDEMDVFEEQLISDEIYLVWEVVLRQVEVCKDTEICAEIQDLVSNNVAATAAALSEIFSSEAEAPPMKDRFDTLSSMLTDTLQRARTKATRLVHVPISDQLWADALKILKECSHFSLCAEARHCADNCLASIKKFQKFYQKKYQNVLPTRELRDVKIKFEAALQSVPPAGYSNIYTFPESFSIRVEVVSNLLKICDDETERSVNDTVQRIHESKIKLAAAVEKVLGGDVPECEELLEHIYAMDMVMTQKFWQRCQEVREVVLICRRRDEIESLAKQEHDDTLKLMKDQLFDAARDMASQCHGTKRLLENVKVEKQSRMHNLEAADGVVVPIEIPTDEFSVSFVGTSGLENKSSNQDVLVIDHDLPIDISRKFSAVSEGSSDSIFQHDLKSSNEIDRKTEVGASEGDYEEELFDEEAI